VLRHLLPVLFLLIVPTWSIAAANTKRDVHFHTTDNVDITGTYYPVTQSPAPSALLIHSVFRTRAVWDEFCGILQQNGIAAFAIDLRGHGDSNRKLTAEGPVTLDAHNLAGPDYQDMPLDVEAAIDWLEAQPELDHARIALIGESLGANIALRYAAVNPDLGALVLLSPGLNYRGVRTDDVILQIGKMPLRILVSEYDPVAFESCQHLIAIQKESGFAAATNELITCTGNLHGSDMLLHVRNLPQIVVVWLKLVFAHTSVSSATPAPAAPSHGTTPPAK
jgi:dienelactone hydrolase